MDVRSILHDAEQMWVRGASEVRKRRTLHLSFLVPVIIRGALIEQNRKSCSLGPDALNSGGRSVTEWCSVVVFVV